MAFTSFEINLLNLAPLMASFPSPLPHFPQQGIGFLLGAGLTHKAHNGDKISLGGTYKLLVDWK